MAQVRPMLWLAAAALVAAGCGGGATALRTEADAAWAAYAARAQAPSSPGQEPTMEAPAGPVVFLAPREEAPASAAPSGPAVGTEPAPGPASEKPAPAGGSGDFASIRGRKPSEVVAEDIRAIPRRVRRGLEHTYTKPENLLILATAFGADRIVRHNLDGQIRDELHNDDTSLAETGDFGSVIGNPALHFGIAGAWYLTALHRQDDAAYAKSRTLFQALMVNGLSTMILKVSMDDESPNGEEWGWPSGHASSSMCFASVMHEYYGWKVGLPLYLLAGYSAATRIEDREHDLSDVVFGTALGLVIGHSVVQGELPQVGGFHVLPFGGRGAGGLMLLKRW